MLSAFASAIWARRYATESFEGENVRRGRGDADRARTSLIRRAYEVLGASVKMVTTTPGGGPIPWAEDAVSSIVASVAKGELTVTDFSECASDGEDITQNSSHSHVKFSSNTPTQQLPLLGRPLVARAALGSLEIKFAEPAP